MTTNPGGDSNLLYSAIIVGDFPTPGPAHDGHAFSLIACTDASGATEIHGPVHDGQEIWYKVILSIPPGSSAYILGGQLSVAFPSNPAALLPVLYPVAGYGATTSGGAPYFLNVSARDIPEITDVNSFTAMCIQAYTVSHFDADVNGDLVAHAFYGKTDPDLTQINGVAEIDSPQYSNDSRPVSNSMASSLIVTKAVIPVASAAPASTLTFVVQVAGSGGPYSHTFTVSDGSPSAPWTLSPLTTRQLYRL